MPTDPEEPESDDDLGDAEDSADPILPTVPEELGVDPLFAALLHCAAFLDLGDDAHVAPELALEVLEQLSGYVNRLTPERAAELSVQAERIAEHGEREGWDEAQVELVRRFFYNCGLVDDDDDEPAE